MGGCQKALMGHQYPQETQGMELQKLVGVVSDKLLSLVNGLSPRAGGRGGTGGAADPALPWLLLPSPVSFPSLRENSISKEGGPAIARALQSNSTLRKLE